jgi:putative transposase
MGYIHSNPLADHWNLATRPEDYIFSSASFYEKGKDEFGFLKDIREEF